MPMKKDLEAAGLEVLNESTLLPDEDSNLGHGD
jgi:hypothetical protein